MVYYQDENDKNSFQETHIFTPMIIFSTFSPSVCMGGGDLLYKPHDQCYSCIYIPPVSFCCSYCCISVSSLQFLSKKLLISYIFSNSIFLNDSAENLMDYILHYFPNHSVNSKKITNNGISTKPIQLELTNTILEQLQKCNDAIVNVN